MKEFTNRIKELYVYRAMIWMLVRRDLRGRYKGSALGFLWSFLNPLLQLAVYTLVFSVIMRSGIEKYYLFLFVALIPWLFFATSVQGGALCIVSQASLVTKIYFPRQVLPIAHVTTCFVNMLLSMLVVLAAAVLTNGLNPAVLVYLIPIMLIEFVLALGVTMLICGITVFLRDVEYIMSIAMMAWQFLTPVMYSEEMVPEEVKLAFAINPMTAVIMAYRDVLYYKQAPRMETMLLALAMGVIFLVVGWFSFEKMQRRFAEEI